MSNIDVDDMHGYTFQEQAILENLKLAAGIGLEEDDTTKSEDLKYSDARWSDVDSVVSSGPFKGEGVVGINAIKNRRLSVKDLADQMIAVGEGPSDVSKVYAKLLLPNEKVVYDSIVWKRAGLSFKNRILILTNKPRLFYTTPQGHFKGLVPWSMTEPITITKIDETRFDIALNSSSRIYHFNDKQKGSNQWIILINELSECWRQYLENR